MTAYDIAQSADDGGLTPGLLAFLLLLSLGIATWLLLRSMAKHLRRIDVDRTRDPGHPADGRREPPEPPDAP